MPPRRRVSTQQVQSVTEGVEIVGDGRKVTFMGQEFRMAEKVGLMPLLHLAVVGKSGTDAADMEGLAALYEMIRDCIDESEWGRFQKHAIDTKADSDDIMKVVGDVIAAVTARKSNPPGNSLAGRQQTSLSSKASLSPTATEPLL